MPTVGETLAVAVQHHQAGHLQAAEQLYRQILAVYPNEANAWHLLGVVNAQLGRQQAGVDCLRRALALRPDWVDALYNLGRTLFEQRKFDEAAACHRRAIELEPGYAEAHDNLGLVFQEQGKLDQAVACHRRALELKPDYAEACVSLANAWQAQGKLDEAVVGYRQALQLKPDSAAAHGNLGNVWTTQGKPDEAVACYRRALQLKPDYAEAHDNLGRVLRGLGKLDEAVACHRRALELKPEFAAAHNNLGLALREQGKLDEAAASYRQALLLKPDFVEPYNNLGNVYEKQGKLAEAVICFRRALDLKPDFPEAHNNLGSVYENQGKLAEAVACYRRALDLKPDFPGAHNNLGSVYQNQGKLAEAVACYRRALELNPDFPEACSNLGATLRDQRKLDDAVACCRRALELKPDFAGAHNNLGATLRDQGKLDEALACYRRAMELNPDFAGAHSNLVYAQIFCPGYDGQTLYEEHRRWNQRHATPLVKFIQPHLNDRSPGRRLRVGYVSPDFRSHPVGRFLLPLLESHDHGSFEIFCYASLRIPDAMTDRFRAHADVWRDVLAFSDEQVAHAIRQDGVDILADLTMHMRDNRLLVFARKPAPVQVTYLAYCGTTGLSTIDYRLTDPYLDPPGRDERIYSEESVRLPETYWCYRPAIETPPVNALPALEAGHVTFGSLNNFCKVTPPALAAWSRVLQAVPGSRLFLHAHAGSHRDRVRGFLTEQGISAERLTFVDFLPMTEYFGVYQRVDVALDPFPYVGGITTCDALWMGVPLVSLAGQTAVGRGGLSILSTIGLPELVARDPEQYVRIAVELAQGLSRLSELRATLRDRVQASPLMDAPRFARNIKAAYREMWRRWCVK
jgi:predicted O-linked N-acetylglucosamine transferase (SPINDLY family)